MYEEKTFEVRYPTGQMTINVGTFFSTANKPQIAKLLRLAKQHCTEEQRKKLIEYLRFERNYRKNVLETLSALENQKMDLLNTLHRASLRDTGAEKALRKQMEKLCDAIETVKEARWNEYDSPPVD